MAAFGNPLALQQFSSKTLDVSNPLAVAPILLEGIARSLANRFPFHWLSAPIMAITVSRGKACLESCGAST